MRYEGNIYRPPSEARSYLLQVTIGCAHNECTFCNMFKDKEFRVRDEEEVMEDLELCRRVYSYVRRIFLCDGDALCLSTDRLIRILDRIKELFPECERVGAYGSPKDVLRKTEDELKLLKEHGLAIIYIGAESGNEEVLRRMHKGATREEIITAVNKIEDNGMEASVTFISGLGGKELWREHAVDTGTMISAMRATYISLLTLMVERPAPLVDLVEEGKFEVLSPEEVVAETYLLMQNTDVDPEHPCVFRSNHASNYLSLKGDLPMDKDRFLSLLEAAAMDSGMLKDERFRAL